MKIYCSGPISGNKEYQNSYLEIINYLTSQNHIAFSQLNKDFNMPVNISDNEIYMRDINWIEHSKLLIAEVSGSSTGVGFEISYALHQKKMPILALAHSNVKRVTAMLLGCDDTLLTLKRYSNIEEMKKYIDEFISLYT
ncbi:MAG: hypothetical protein COW08_01380 [Ignavibacteriales bacterium CG12_big_fil_rev_8_21_14_0_65_30_8]|nr:MAG: hypothetical protein COW08_01380 [Ignavibacteriales bacterium CG12_big_fil_rev_8_21_14_0_65_30_8]